MAYTDPKTGTTYTSPEVAKQNGVDIGNATSGTPIAQQVQQANQASPTLNPVPLAPSAPPPATAPPPEPPSTAQPVANFPINTSQPSPDTVNATPYTQGLQTAQNSGQKAPQDAGTARGLVDQTLQKIPQVAPTTTPNVDNFFNSQVNPTLQDTLKQISDFINPTANDQLLKDQLAKISTDNTALAGLNTQAMNFDNLMAGNEQAIRDEITKSGTGMASEQQVQALKIARNQTLLQQQKIIQQQIQTAQNQVANDTSLFNQEKDMANTQFSQRTQIYQLAQQNQQNIQNASKDAIKTILDMPGGLQAYVSNPQQAAYAEQVMGYAPGTLTNLNQQQQADTTLKNLANYTISSPYIVSPTGTVIDTQTGYNFTSQQDFINRTGMDTAVAGSQGLIKPLGQTKADQQQVIDNQFKVANLAIAQQNANRLSSGGSTGGNGLSSGITNGTGNIPSNLQPYLNTSSSGVQYIDASTLQGTPTQKNALVNQATAAGLKVITNKNTAADLINIQDAKSKLDTIGGIMKDIGQPNWVSRLAGGLGINWLQKATQSSPQKAAAGALQSVGLDILKAISGVQGFRGNQSAIQQVTDHLPKVTDTVDTINAKIGYINQLISDRENAILDSGSNSTDQVVNGVTYTKGADGLYYPKQ